MAENINTLILGFAVSDRSIATIWGIFQKVVQVPGKLLIHESMSWQNVSMRHTYSHSEANDSKSSGEEGIRYGC